jgi:hypothetical protein
VGIFKKSLSETDKQLWAIGLLGFHLKSRDSETIGAIGGAIGAGIAFASPPSIAISGMTSWIKDCGSHTAIRGLSTEDKTCALSDYNSARHLNAKKELLDVLREGSEVALYLVVPVFTRALVTPDLPEDYDWMDQDSSIRELSHYASDCLKDAAGSYIDSNGKHGTTAYEFVLDSLCYAGSVLRV